MPDLATGAAVAFTTQTALEQTTSATELGHSATVLRTSTGNSTLGSSWGGTSTEGTYSSPGLSGISMRAHALVPVGSDGLSYAFNNNPTNYIGDYSWTANDLLGGGSSAAPEAQGFSRNFDTSLTTQKTIAATAGASTTNSDNAGSAGSNAGAYGSNGGSTSYSSSGNNSYGTGNGGSSGSAAEAEAEAMFGPAGLHFIKTTGMIIANGDAAAMKSVTNQIASAIAKFIVCDGNSCASDEHFVGAVYTPESYVDGHWALEPELVSKGYTVQTAGQSGGMSPELADATDEALEDEVTRLMKVIAKLNHEIDDLDKELERLHTNEGAERNIKRKESRRLGKSLNRRDAAILLDNAQQRTGRSPTGNLVATSFTGFADIRKGNTYANAWNEPWVQEAQYYCYAVAIGSGAIIVVWVAAPAAIAGGKAVASGASFAYAQPILAANLTGAYLARNPGVLQEGLEGGTAFVMAYSETGSVVDATASAGISLLPSAPVTVYQVKALSKAQGVNYTGFKVKICVESQGAGEVAPDSGLSRTIYRSMTEGSDGLPKTGPTARQLGVRPHDDIPVTGGNVSPMTGGMSVAPDTPGNLPSHRRPPSLGGTGKDPVWEFDLNNLGDGVRFRQDSQTHGLLEPGSVMSIDEFQKALAELAKYWSKR